MYEEVVKTGKNWNDYISSGALCRSSRGDGMVNSWEGKRNDE